MKRKGKRGKVPFLHQGKRKKRERRERERERKGGTMCTVRVVGGVLVCIKQRERERARERECVVCCISFLHPF